MKKREIKEMEKAEKIKKDLIFTLKEWGCLKELSDIQKDLLETKLDVLIYNTRTATLNQCMKILNK